MAEYEDMGYGTRGVGFGQRPAILVVDFQRAFTDPEFPLGRAEHVANAVAATVRLLEAARPLGVPVAKCVTAYESPRDVPYWKLDVLHTDFFQGHPGTEVDPRVHDPGHDFTFVKSGPSIFFETPLKTFLIKHRVDTTIITGCTTSGCIRASIIDAFSSGYRVIVPEECVGDMAPGPHVDNLRDCGRRYADVISLAETLAALEPGTATGRAHSPAGSVA